MRGGLEETGYQMESWVRDKGSQVVPRSDADVCSNTSEQRIWLGFWRSWSYELWRHPKSHKTAGGKCDFRPKLERVNPGDTTRPIVGATTTTLPRLLTGVLLSQPMAVLSFTSVTSLARVPILSFFPPSHHDGPIHLQTKVGDEIEDVSPSTTNTQRAQGQDVVSHCLGRCQEGQRQAERKRQGGGRNSGGWQCLVLVSTSFLQCQLRSLPRVPLNSWTHPPQTQTQNTNIRTHHALFCPVLVSHKQR